MLLLFLALAPTACKDRSSPEYAAEAMIRALQEQDRLTLEMYLHQARLAENFVDQAHQQALEEARGRPGAQRELHLGMSLGRGAQVEAARVTVREVLEQLTSGELTDDERAELGRIRIGDVRQTEHTAAVEIFLPLPSAEEPTSLTGRMERTGDRWRLVGLDGLAALAN